MFSKKIVSLKELEKVAEELIKMFPEQRIFAFYGKMGAGKTTFISPTFALINEYKRKDLSSIFHFDFYRIKNPEEAYDLGYEDYLYSGEYCLIEWPELIETLLPNNIIEVKIKVNEDESRIISAQKI